VLAEPVCARCGSTVDLTGGHRWPLVRGGSNDQSNLETLCRVCNDEEGSGLRLGGWGGVGWSAGRKTRVHGE